jgi:ketosteroid isomerase-like protein
MALSPGDVAALRAAERSLVESFEASEPTAWVDFYTDDAVFVAPGIAAIEGRGALLAHARQMTPLSSAHIDAQTTDGDGDLAATLGIASWVNGSKDSGGPESRLRFLIVWRREGDGRWRIARELLNSDV